MIYIQLHFGVRLTSIAVDIGLEKKFINLIFILSAKITT